RVLRGVVPVARVKDGGLVHRGHAGHPESHHRRARDALQLFARAAQVVVGKAGVRPAVRRDLVALRAYANHVGVALGEAGGAEERAGDAPRVEDGEHALKAKTRGLELRFVADLLAALQRGVELLDVEGEAGEPLTGALSHTGPAKRRCGCPAGRGT